MPPPIPATRSRPPDGRPAILLSALVYPGAGQGLQGRWFAAIGFGLLFTLALIGFGIELVRVFLAYAAVAVFDKPPPEDPGMSRFVASLIAMFVAYLASLLDTILAAQRVRRRHAPPA